MTTKILTMSLVYTCSGALNYNSMVALLNARYEPELFTAAMIRDGHVHFTCFRTGKIVITGVHSRRDIDNIVLPKLIELEMHK